MLKIAICDDENYMVVQIQEMLFQITTEKGIEIETAVFSDGLLLEKNYLFGERYDLIYLDIEMNSKNGIDAAKAIREIDQTVIIIYVSGYKEYIKELLEVEAFRFISKPIDKLEFDDYFMKAYEKIKQYAQYFEFQYKRVRSRILIGNIVYFESNGRTLTVVLADGTRDCFYGKLIDVENTLRDSNVDFLRIHQSFLVSYRYIQKMTRTKIELQSGEELRISEDRQKEFRQKYCLLLGGEICDWN